MPVDDTVIIAAFSTAFSAMGTVIVTLWRKQARDYAKLEKRADDCESHRSKLEHEMSELRSLKALIESCPAPRCPLDEKPKRETTRIILKPAAA